MRNIIIIGMLFLSLVSYAQQTVGLFQNSPESFNGYTLISPMNSTTSYLIDNCGELVHSWEGNTRPGLCAYLKEDGSLLRSGSLSNNPFIDGTIRGGLIEIFDWNNNLLWSYAFAGDNFCGHHDLALMPNGNILAIAVDRKTSQETLDAGRLPNTFSTALYSEKIVELRPIGNDSAEIVWEWNLWDHLVQDIDSTLSNFGIVANHPELIDINYFIDDDRDWIHLNSIDYNPDLDQIMVSSRNFSELWIIDHSTTTAEAATHTGGDTGAGGDILYRWGNPEAYDRGTAFQRHVFGLHDPVWVKEGNRFEGGISFFNNGNYREDVKFSAAQVIFPPLEADKTYSLGNIFLPYEPDYQYIAADSVSFYSRIMSGVEVQPNGNMLICSGESGDLFEIDEDGNTVWRYVNPISNSGPIEQGNTAASNGVFKISRFAPDFIGFLGRDLTPQGPVEINPLPQSCEITVGIKEQNGNNPLFKVFPNPVKDILYVELTNAETEGNLSLVNQIGQQVFNVRMSSYATIDLQDLQKGMYFLVFNNGKTIETQKIIVQ